MPILIRPHHISAIDTWAHIGQILSGVSFSVTAIATLITLIFVNSNSADAVWLDKFRNLYGEFWNDPHMREARNLIANKEGYDRLSKILNKRGLGDECNVSKEEYLVLEEIDNFLSVLVRVRSFAVSTAMTDNQIEIWGDLLFNYWIAKIETRSELNSYVNKFWKNLLKRFLIRKRKWYKINY